MFDFSHEFIYNLYKFTLETFLLSPHKMSDYERKSAMDINYFREFVVLSENGNYMEAADKLFISQSALSRHIKTMEDELGISLFDRTTRKIKLTQIGEAFLPYARKIADMQFDYQKFLYDEAHHAHESLIIGSVPSMTQGSVADALETFRRKHPSYHINTIEADSLQLLEMLHNKECDMAFLRGIEDAKDEFCTIPVLRDSMVAIFPADHPLAEKASVSIEELAEEPLLWLAKNTFMYTLCQKTFQKEGLKPNVVFTSHNGDNIIYHVGRDLGIAMLMKNHAQRLVNSEVKLVDIQPPITSTIMLTYLKDKKLNSVSRQFIEMISSLSKGTE